MFVNIGTQDIVQVRALYFDYHCFSFFYKKKSLNNVKYMKSSCTLMLLATAKSRENGINTTSSQEFSIRFGTFCLPLDYEADW